MDNGFLSERFFGGRVDDFHGSDVLILGIATPGVGWWDYVELMQGF